MLFFCIFVHCMLVVTGKEKQLDRVQSRMESIQKSLSVQVGIFIKQNHRHPIPAGRIYLLFLISSVYHTKLYIIIIHVAVYFPHLLLIIISIQGVNHTKLFIAIFGHVSSSSSSGSIRRGRRRRGYSDAIEKRTSAQRESHRPVSFVFVLIKSS